MSPDFDELVGTDLAPDERERLERVHDLLVAAGPPPDADAQARVVVLPRRRRGALLAIAAALAVTVFALGGALVRGGDDEFVISMAGTAAAPAASASLRVFELDDAGNWPMEVAVEGLQPASSGRAFELWLTRDGELEGLCGSFLTNRLRSRGRPDERAVPLRRVRRLGRRRGRIDHAAPHDLRRRPAGALSSGAWASTRTSCDTCSRTARRRATARAPAR